MTDVGDIYWTCETHPHLLWSGAHVLDDGPVCPPDCGGPGMPAWESLTEGALRDRTLYGLLVERVALEKDPDVAAALVLVIEEWS